MVGRYGVGLNTQALMESPMLVEAPNIERSRMFRENDNNR
jgi:hypothetical protein